MTTRKAVKFFLFFSLGGLVLLILALLIANFRYPFFNPSGGGWSVGYKYIKDPRQKLDPEDSKVLSFDWLDAQTNEKTKFLADPFVLHEDGKFYIFFEHQAEGNANVGLLESVDGLNYTYKGEVLDEDFHLSFPQVFINKGEYYMLPESKAAGNILLYKANDFPYGWQVHDTLVKDVRLKDPVILLTDSLKIITATDDELRQVIYESDSLEGPWIKDTSFERRGDGIRGGGNFFEVDGKWYVPFQKNNNGYGTGLALYEFLVEKKEKKFKKVIDPYLKKSDSIKWFGKGMHQMSVIKVNEKFYSVFDGDIEDPLAGRQATWKASLKYNFYDFLNLFR
ncbi:hypothetical protein HC174_12685 [Salinimicrobium sp. CDJ15-81-2]|nr:hypothetical protein [Salinimicrobium nanhaiense]